MTPFNMVLEFHRSFSLPVNTEGELPSLKETYGRHLRLLRMSLLSEEFEELCVAESNRDVVEIADALGDIVYIVCGTAMTYGFVVDDVLVEQNPDWGDGISGAYNSLHHAYVRYCRAEIASDQNAIRESLSEIIRKVNDLAKAQGIPLREVYEEIHRSNMSKLDPDTGKPIYRNDGKVLKGRAYSPPDITTILKRYDLI